MSSDENSTGGAGPKSYRWETPKGEIADADTIHPMLFFHRALVMWHHCKPKDIGTEDEALTRCIRIDDVERLSHLCRLFHLGYLEEKARAKLLETTNRQLAGEKQSVIKQVSLLVFVLACVLLSPHLFVQ